MVKKIAITGGIGSGKSTVLKILKDEGFSVFSCDEIYKEILSDKEYIQKICLAFPSVIENNAINKKKLADIIFNNKEKRALLDSIAHPLIMGRLREKMSQENGLVFAEVPLLFESGYEHMFDGVIVVQRSINDRIHAVAARDKLGENEVISRINSQYNYDMLEMDATKNEGFIQILYNNQSIEDLKNRLKNIIEKFA